MLWHGIEDYQPSWRTGHEWMGIVEEVGSQVRNLKKGVSEAPPLEALALAPFDFSDGTYVFCGKELQTSCIQGSF